MRLEKYYIITIGCQMNKSDSERVAGHLESQGMKKARTRIEADLVVLTTCGIRQAAENRIYGLIPRIKKDNPKARIMLTGCLSLREDVKKRVGDKIDFWLPITEIGNFLIQKPKAKIQNPGDYLKLIPKYSSSFSAFVPIGNGCDNFCTYCVVPYARGREVYRDVEDILDEVKDLVEKGCKEITLIAQNVNSYNFRISNSEFRNNYEFLKSGKMVNFPLLLRLVNDLEGDFWLRFATSHPKDMSDELVHAIAECNKVCEHVHLPVQAGDDHILQAMNRKYTRGYYIKLVNKIREQVNKKKTGDWSSPVSITTDIIVGFPGESREQFKQTKDLFCKLNFDMAYIARYSSRPGTVAEELADDVSAEEKKQREEGLMQVLRKTAFQNNKKYIGKVVDVLVEGRNKKGEWFGKTRTSKVVRIINMSEEGLVGEFVKTKIKQVQDFGLEGELVF